jgi:hypothetical protein
MTTAMQVKQSETGLVRLFAVDLAPQEAQALKEQPDALPALLGISALDADHWELFDLADLSGLGLESYLAEGHGIAEDDLAPMRWQLDALEGPVFILRSAAIAARPATLTPRPPLRWIATFGELKAPVPLHSDLSSEAARGGLAPPALAPRGPRGSIVVLVLGLVLTAAIALALYLILTGDPAP